MRYTNLFCVSCFMELIRPQLTCGKSACMTAWKTMSDDQKDRARALAAMSRSERALASVEEEAIRSEERKQRAAEAFEQLETYQAKKQENHTPAFLRAMLSPEFAPIKKENSNEANELPNAQSETKD